MPNWTDDSTKGAVYTFFFTPTGVDRTGTKTFVMASFVRIHLADPLEDPTNELVVPISFYDNVLADPIDNPPNFKIEFTNGGPIPLPQPTDSDQRSLHFFGPV